MLGAELIILVMVYYGYDLNRTTQRTFFKDKSDLFTNYSMQVLVGIYTDAHNEATLHHRLPSPALEHL